MKPSKSEIKLIRSLSKKKYRDLNNLYVIEGEKIVAEAKRTGKEIVKIFRKEEIGEELMNRITLLSSPSPELAVVRISPEHELVYPEIDNLYLALDSVRDPGNMGTIIRLSEWFGVDRIYCSLDCVDIYNPKVIQSSMGSVFRVKVHYTDLSQLIKNKTPSIPVYGTFLEGNNIYEQEKKNGLIVMGNESKGISSELSSLIEHKITIPPFSKKKDMDSLNVAIAAAIICSEFRNHPSV
jgi:RNA methyltransferase, TrmH family